MRATMAALVLVASVAPAMAQSPRLTRPTLALTQAGAEAALRSAERLAGQAGDPAAIAVVNTDGRLLAFLTMDGVRPGSGDLAIGKARAAALMQRPTEELEANVAAGRVALATSGLTALRGGAPLRVDGVIVGAVGVAGTRKEDDARTAAAVSASFGATS
ncbi:MAG: heme-binding protein [Caulobacteraceae bacterium]|nr:heme-binding protein [Caulobacteraceae bacterium]